MIKVGTWVLGVLSLISVIMYFDLGDHLSGVICMFAAGFFFPPVLNKINKINKTNKEKAESKGKTHKDITQKSAVIFGIILLAIAAILSSGSNTETNNNTQSTPTEQTQERKQLKPIDLIYQLKSKIDELDYWFKGAFKESDKLRFYDVKKNYEKQLDVICSDFDRLVENTGNLNSEYYDEALACSNFELSLVHVIQNLNHGTYAEIPKLRQKLEPAYQNLKQQVDEEIKRLNNK